MRSLSQWLSGLSYGAHSSIKQIFYRRSWETISWPLSAILLLVFSTWSPSAIFLLTWPLCAIMHLIFFIWSLKAALWSTFSCGFYSTTVLTLFLIRLLSTTSLLIFATGLLITVLLLVFFVELTNFFVYVLSVLVRASLMGSVSLFIRWVILRLNVFFIWFWIGI